MNRWMRNRNDVETVEAFRVNSRFSGGELLTLEITVPQIYITVPHFHIYYIYYICYIH
jgi:hypothetical protein